MKTVKVNTTDLSELDSGYYNEAIKGYLIKAMQNVDFEREDIKKVLNGIAWALSENTADEATKIYQEF